MVREDSSFTIAKAYISLFCVLNADFYPFQLFLFQNPTMIGR